MEFTYTMLKCVMAAINLIMWMVWWYDGMMVWCWHTSSLGYNLTLICKFVVLISHIPLYWCLPEDGDLSLKVHVYRKFVIL
jgi:hypothetical protein